MLRFRVWAITSVGAILAVGCGAPDFAHMHPSVWKPAADVLLVGHPVNWSAASAAAWAAEQGVAARASQAAASSWQKALSTWVSRPDIGLHLVVFPGPVPPAALAFARLHPQVRFEFVGTGQPDAPLPPNVRLVVPDGTTVGYWSGWLAGQIAASRGDRVVGWYQGDGATPPRSEIEAALVGLYTANPGISIQSVAPPQSRPASGQAAAVQALPGVVLAVSPVTGTISAQVASRGGCLLSLSGLPSTAVAGTEPAVPGPSVVATDLAAYRARRWQAGRYFDQISAPDSLQCRALPASLVTSWQRAASVTVVTPQVIQQLWAGLPATVQKAWAAWLPSAPLAP